MDTPTQRDAPETWESLSSNRMQNQAGRYLILELEYSEIGQTTVKYIQISDAILLSSNDDIDGDGIANEWDKDMDGDGVDNHIDSFPEDINHSIDIDGDGLPDTLDDKDIVGVEIISNDTYTIDNNELVRFIPITLSNGGTLLSTHTSIGNTSIVDNTLLYQASNEMPQQMYLEYEWVNENGETQTDQLLLLANNINITKPVFDDVTPQDIQATGLFTSITGLSPTARDVLGNPVPVSLQDDTPRLRAGNHVVYWQATDPITQATQTVGQLYRVFPLVDFEQREQVYEGGQAKIKVHLSGPSPVYPVSIPVIIDASQSSSDLSDHSLDAEHIITINSGLNGETWFTVVGDEVSEGDETLTLIFGEEVNQGPFEKLSLAILETEPMPSIKANIVDSQGKIRSLTYPEFTNKLALKAEIFKPQESMQVAFTWYIQRDDSKVRLGETVDEGQIELGESLEPGRYHFSYEAQVLGSSLAPLTGQTTLRVMKTSNLSAQQDSDMDGIPDKLEGFTDSDQDLIPDYLDAIHACELQIIDNEKAQGGGFVLQSSPGSCIQLGKLSEKVGTYSPYVSHDLHSSTTDNGDELLPPDNENIEIYTENDVNNFTITEVFGDSVTIVLPLIKPLTENSIYRKYTEREGWFTFDESDTYDNLRYALGELGFCPPPGSDDYVETPIIGAYCLEVTIKDGGRHDDDKEHNGQVDDPGYMAYPQNNLVIPGFTVDATRLPFHDETRIKLQFNLCDYISTNCQDLSVINSSVEYGGEVQITDHEITVILPSWVDSVLLNLTITDGQGVVNVPVVLNNSPSQSSVELNSYKQVRGGALDCWVLWLLWLSVIMAWRERRIDRS
ncbi:thrombospondin type 3 repeat-containing protein [Aliivibrio finisterrensis]|uniref:thrombospondin type 3 repeat-containing protein n=1 Tax=Aliivibrio finisterrensis TaxID=511998 RepID=UPI00124C997C|nr:thrombospondin type 3 repeat-containing protein [Aliivibrio finisterrensis]